MSKRKKKNPAADDLIESLMKDLKESPSSETPSDENDLFAGMLPEDDGKGGFLTPEGHEMGDPPTAIGNLWSDLGQGLPPAAPGDEIETPENLDLPPLPIDDDAAYGGQSADEGGYQGPSAGDGGYQSPNEIFGSEAVGDETRPLASSEDKTVSIQKDPYSATAATATRAAGDGEKTLAVSGFANAKVGGRRQAEPEAKVSIGQLRGSSSRSSVYTSVDASLVQSDNLKLAQQRLLELERELDKLRAENEELASAGDIIRQRADEYSIRIAAMEKEKREVEESYQSEVLILKGNLQYKESEVAKSRLRIEELELRLKSDFKKIRVRERELENRLELIRAEKAALIRAKDESILDLKRKIDQLQSELDNYRGKVLELNKTIDINQEQFKRTVRALRLALSNLEVKDENVVPLKKAE